MRLHDALRAGVALGLAVWVAGVGDFAHGFWVALGTLAVLRTSVLAGQRTAVQAIIGTTVGFFAAFPLVWLVGSSKVLPWVLIPPLVFLSAYTSGALPFAVGQGAFTAFVVLSVNILEPKGWHTGAIRVEDVLAGTAVALVAGVVFWPRGARVQVRRRSRRCTERAKRCSRSRSASRCAHNLGPTRRSTGPSPRRSAAPRRPSPTSSPSGVTRGRTCRQP